jgi:hypothetical protein
MELHVRDGDESTLREIYLSGDVCLHVLSFLPIHTLITTTSQVNTIMRRLTAETILPKQGVVNVQYLTKDEYQRYNDFHVFVSVTSQDSELYQLLNVQIISDDQLFSFLGNHVKLILAKKPYIWESSYHEYLERRFALSIHGYSNILEIEDIDRSKNPLIVYFESVFMATHIMKYCGTKHKETQDAIIIRASMDSVTQLFLCTLDLFSIMTGYRDCILDELSLSCSKSELHYVRLFNVYLSSKQWFSARYGCVSLLENNANIRTLRLTSEWPALLFSKLILSLQERDRRMKHLSTRYTILFNNDFVISGLDNLELTNNMWPIHLSNINIESTNMENIGRIFEYFKFDTSIHMTLTIRSMKSLHLLFSKNLQDSITSLTIEYDLIKIMDEGLEVDQLIDILLNLKKLQSLVLSSSTMIQNSDLTKYSTQISKSAQLYRLIGMNHPTLNTLKLKDMCVPYPTAIKLIETQTHNFVSEGNRYPKCVEITCYLPRNTIQTPQHLIQIRRKIPKYDIELLEYNERTNYLVHERNASIYLNNSNQSYCRLS